MNHMNLLVIYIDGKHEQGMIELHDMRFVVANTIEETYDSLINGLTSWQLVAGNSRYRRLKYQYFA